MPLPIEDYALIGDLHTGALVGVDGSIDWLCLPRFDSPSTFGGLLGSDDHGHWRVAPHGAGRCTSRRYRDGTFVLESRWVTDTGEVEVVDLMPIGGRRADLIRRVRGIRGSVTMRQELRVRFDYADSLAWVRQIPDGSGTAFLAVAGPDSVIVRGPKLEAGDGYMHSSEFVVEKGEVVDIVMTWYPSHREVPDASPVDADIERTERHWRAWRMETNGDPYDQQVERSLLTLRALTNEDTGGIVAAATTSLPERFGGTRNWDYRYVWLRDASLTVQALIQAGFDQEIRPWREWLLRAIAGDAADMQIMYGLAGERRLVEWEVPTLPGYLGAQPVRVGNAAYTQFQSDIFGEVMVALDLARRAGARENEFSWALQMELLGFLEGNLDRLGQGIWESRGAAQHYTHSRAMVWAAFDRGIAAIDDFELKGPRSRWADIRDRLHDEIEEQGFSTERGSYLQFYGGHEVDASLLVLPQIGYIAADDPRMLGTVAAIEADLLRDGLLMRYRPKGLDGIHEDENPFLACSFWLVEQYAASGRTHDAVTLMDRLVGFCNDVGLLSEEYDVTNSRQAGNTPQALSHIGLVRAAAAIAEAQKRGSR